MKPLWMVRRATYATYAEIAERGDIEPVVVARGLSFDEAMKLAANLGFGHSVHQEEIVK